MNDFLEKEINISETENLVLYPASAVAALCAATSTWIWATFLKLKYNFFTLQTAPLNDAVMTDSVPLKPGNG